MTYTKIYGGSGGKSFNDRLPDGDMYNPDWRLSNIRIRDGDKIDGIQLYHKNEKTNYKKTHKFHGASGGDSKYEDIAPGECIHGI